LKVVTQTIPRKCPRLGCLNRLFTFLGGFTFSCKCGEVFEVE
jgi:hypothetical protein